MKKAEEYMKKFWSPDTDDNTTIIDIIKQAQIDAIDATVKKCAKKATVTYIDLTSDEVFDYTDVLIDDNVDIIVNKQSILQVAEELKKELE
jgi:hypothetical protein